MKSITKAKFNCGKISNLLKQATSFTNSAVKWPSENYDSKSKLCFRHGLQKVTMKFEEMKKSKKVDKFQNKFEKKIQSNNRKMEKNTIVE